MHGNMDDDGVLGELIEVWNGRNEDSRCGSSRDELARAEGLEGREERIGIVS